MSVPPSSEVVAAIGMIGLASSGALCPFAFVVGRADALTMVARLTYAPSTVGHKLGIYSCAVKSNPSRTMRSARKRVTKADKFTADLFAVIQISKRVKVTCGLHVVMEIHSQEP